MKRRVRFIGGAWDGRVRVKEEADLAQYCDIVIRCESAPIYWPRTYFREQHYYLRAVCRGSRIQRYEYVHHASMIEEDEP